MAVALKQPVVMTVAGVDPSAGAGTLADIKTIAAFECYGVAAVTSLTFQNTQQVFDARHQSAETVRRQMTALFDDFEVAAVKTGMLPTPEIVFEVAGIIKARGVPIVVVDPVLKSTSGYDLAAQEVASALRSTLFPLASLVTPNVTEAQRISGEEIGDSITMQRAAEAILVMGPGAVIITGGDSEADSSTDLLLDAQGFSLFSAQRIKSANTHGTGCTLASALACLLARGWSLREAIPIAKQYISKAIFSAPPIGHGHGPLNHFPPGFEILK